MINGMYTVLEDATKCVATAAVLYEGTPVTIDATGCITQAVGDVYVYGLSKLPKNTYRDMTYSYTDTYGSRKTTVVKGGIIQLYPSVYTTADNTAVQVDLWDSGVDSAAFGTSLYVDDAGLITTTATNSLSLFAKVVYAPDNNVNNPGVLEIEMVV